MRSAAVLGAWLVLVAGCSGAGVPPDAPKPTRAPSGPATTASAQTPRASAELSSLPSLVGLALPNGQAIAPGDPILGSTVPAGSRLGEGAWLGRPWLVALASGASTTVDAAAVEVQGVVLEGDVELRDLSRNAVAARPLHAWTAFRAPGAAISLVESGGAPARLVLFVVSPEKKPIAPLLDDPQRSLGRQRRDHRTGSIEVVDLASRPPLRWGKGKLEARIAWETPGAPAALDLVMFAADAAVAEHAHAGAWECLFPLRAAGEVVIEGKPQAVRPGEPVCIPPDALHAWKPAGTEPLWAIQLYSPAGAEQRFRDLAAKEP